VRGGNLKFRALRLESGNFSWGTEGTAETVTAAASPILFSLCPSADVSLLLSACLCCVVATSRKTRILDVVYNASNNELVRTKTLVKGAIVQVDATPFRQWYEQHYNVTIGKKAKAAAAAAGAEGKAEEEKKKGAKALKKAASRLKSHTLEAAVKDQFLSGRLYASISSRPGQSGRCDGYILEDKELDFYLRKITKKK
jgi:small subunit ribosomal protein S8e